LQSRVWNLLPHFGTELFTVAFGIIIVACATKEMGGGRLAVAQPWQVRLGEWSFAFYLVHATIIYVFLAVFGLQDTSWWNLLWTVALLAVSIPVAGGMHHWVEKPLER